MMLQLSGVASITYYVPTIYIQRLGFADKTSELLAACSMFAYLVGSITCSFTVGRFGRRSLMLFSAAAMSINLILVAILSANPQLKGGLKAAVFFIFIYCFCYNIGFLGMPFLYACEIAPGRHRAARAGVAIAAAWLCNFAVGEVTPVAFTDISWRYFIVYAALNASFLPIIYFFFPETNCKTSLLLSYLQFGPH